VRRATLLLVLVAVLALFGAPQAARAQGEPLWARVVRPLLARQVPGLQIEGLSGTLTRDPRAARITLSDAQGPWLVLEDAGLVIDRAALFRGNVRLEEITAARGRLARLPAGAAAATPAEEVPPEARAELPTLPQLSFGIQVDRFAIGQFELGEPVLGLAATLTVEGRIALARGRLDAAFSAQRLDAPGSLRMEVALDPPADRLQAAVTLDEPPGGLIGAATGLRDQPANLTLRLEGPASGARLDARGAIGPDVSLALRGTLRAAASGNHAAVLDGEIAAAPLLPPALRPIATPFALRLDAALSAAQRLTLNEARFTVPGGMLRLEGSADLPANTVDLHFATEVPDSARFGALVPDLVAWQALRSEGRVRGSVDAPHVTATLGVQGFASRDVRIAALLGAAPRLEIDAALPERIERLVVTGSAAAFDVTGRIAEPLDATARLAFPDLGVLGDGFGGALRVALHATGARADPTLALTAHGDELRLAGHALTTPDLTALIATPFSAPRIEAHMDAQYAGLPLTLDVLGEPEGDRLRLRRAAAVFGPASLDAEGVLDIAQALFAGMLTLDAPHLAPFSAVAGMPLAGGVRLAGRFTTPDGRQGFDLRADLSAFRAGATQAAGSVTARGTPADGMLTFDGNAAGAALRTNASWTTTADGRRITVPALDARFRGEAFRLSSPARMLMPPQGGVTVEALSLTAGRGGSVAVTGRWGPDQADIAATLNAIPLRLLSALAGAGPPLDGTLGGRLRATGATAAPDWQAALRIAGLRAAVPWAARLPAAEIRLDANGRGSARAELRGSITAGQAVRLAGTAQLAGGFAASAPIAASLDGTADLGVLAAPFLASGADRVTGRLALALRAQGRVGDPQWGGEATLASGSYRNAVQGIALTDIAGTIAGAQDRLVIRSMTARTPNRGTIAVQGTLHPGTGGIGADLTLQARNARPVQSELVTATLDADLTLTGTLPDAARLAGTVNLGTTEIRVPERLPANVRTIPNVRERGRNPARAARPAPTPASGLPPIALAVNAVASRAVFVRGRGIDAELSGNISVDGTLAGPVPHGGFELRRGSLTLLDRRLTFRSGRIDFTAGTLTPSLDLRAESRVREVTINVTIDGPATDPKLTFSSTPELPQDEILSRLLFDRPARELSPFQIAMLAEAAAGAAGYRGPTAGGVMERIRRTLALDRLSVGSADSSSASGRNDTPGAAVEGGRYVAEGVYVGIRQGTTGGPPRVAVQIDVLPRVRVEAETGGNSRGGDRVGVSYELEY